MKGLVGFVCVPLFALLPAAVVLFGASCAQAAGMAGPRGTNGAKMFRPQSGSGMMQPSAFSSFMNSNPFGMAMLSQSGRGNPYSSMSSSYGAMGSGMGSGGYGGSGGGGYGNSQETTQSSGYPPTDPTTAPQSYAVPAQASSQGSDLSRVLTSSGVPNENGLLSWPVGLLALAGPEVDQMRDGVEALFQRAAAQSADGNSDAQLREDLRNAIGRLRGALLKDKNERFALPLAVYDESERFLSRLDRAEHCLGAALRQAGSSASETER